MRQILPHFFSNNLTTKKMKKQMFESQLRLYEVLQKKT